MAELVKRIRLQASTEGVDQAAASLNKLGAATDNVIRISDKSARSQLSVVGAYDRLRASTDAAFKQQQQFARGQQIIDRAMQQGIITAQEEARALTQLAEKYRLAEGA